MVIFIPEYETMAAERIVSEKEPVSWTVTRGERKGMNEKKVNRTIFGIWRRMHLIVLFAIVFMVVALNVYAEGSIQCTVPQKESKAMNLAALNASAPRVDLLPIDLIRPAKTEIAVFAMG
jgi:hypothetical protein